MSPQFKRVIVTPAVRLDWISLLWDSEHKAKEFRRLDPALRNDIYWEQAPGASLPSSVIKQNQRNQETLQQYNADIARLVYLALPNCIPNIRERLAVGAFVRGLKDRDTEQALGLAYALEFEAEHKCYEDMRECVK